jgi:hypothetical protein
LQATKPLFKASTSTPPAAPPTTRFATAKRLTMRKKGKQGKRRA